MDRHSSPQGSSESVSMEGVRASTMTCLALETLPLPVYDIMAM